jgi:hypothetical protein
MTTFNDLDLDEPVSPELCLVSPELARIARERLPDLQLSTQPREATGVDAVLRPPDPRRYVARRLPPPLPEPTPLVANLRRRVVVALATAVGVVALGVPLVAGATRVGIDRASVTPWSPPVAPARPATLIVPDLCGQPYVFVKGILQDGGFAWAVQSDGGWSGDVVVWQSPIPGTAVLDTGTPLIRLAVKTDAAHARSGVAQRRSPYPASPARVVHGPTEAYRAIVGYGLCELGQIAPPTSSG